MIPGGVFFFTEKASISPKAASVSRENASIFPEKGHVSSEVSISPEKVSVSGFSREGVCWLRRMRLVLSSHRKDDA